MIKELLRDLTFRLIAGTAIAVTCVYVLLLVLVGFQDKVVSHGRWSHGGAAGLQAFLTALTALVVLYYLIETARLRRASEWSLDETRRLRVAAERGRAPFVVVRFEQNAVIADPGSPIPNHVLMRPALYAVNLGGGPAVDVHIDGLDVDNARTRLPAMSSAPYGLALLATVKGKKVEDFKDRRVSVKCSDPARPGEYPYQWTWIGDPSDGDGFRLESTNEIAP